MCRSIIKTLSLLTLASAILTSQQISARIPGGRSGGGQGGARGGYHYDAGRGRGYDASYGRWRGDGYRYRDSWRDRDYRGRGYYYGAPAYPYYDAPAYDLYYGQPAYSGYDYVYPPYPQQEGIVDQELLEDNPDDAPINPPGTIGSFSNPSSPSEIE